MTTDSGRIVLERVEENSKPRASNPISFIKNLFYAWKKLNKIKHEKGLSNATIGLLFYEILHELFDPKHRNLFLEMLETKNQEQTEFIIPIETDSDEIEELK